MISKAQLVAKVAERHRLVLSDDDPVLAVACMMDVFVETYAKSMEESLNKMQEEIVKGTFQAGQQATQNAEKITIKTLSCFHKLIEDAGQEIRTVAESLAAATKSQTDLEPPKPSRDYLVWMPLIGNSLFFCMNSFLALRNAGIV